MLFITEEHAFMLIGHPGWPGIAGGLCGAGQVSAGRAHVLILHLLIAFKICCFHKCKEGESTAGVSYRFADSVFISAN